MNVTFTKRDFLKWIENGKTEFCKDKELYKTAKKTIEKIFEESATESPDSELDLTFKKKLEDFIEIREAIAGFLSGIAMTESLYLLNDAPDLDLYEQAKKALDDIR